MNSIFKPKYYFLTLLPIFSLLAEGKEEKIETYNKIEIREHSVIFEKSGFSSKKKTKIDLANIREFEVNEHTSKTKKSIIEPLICLLISIVFFLFEASILGTLFLLSSFFSAFSVFIETRKVIELKLKLRYGDRLTIQFEGLKSELDPILEEIDKLV